MKKILLGSATLAVVVGMIGTPHSVDAKSWKNRLKWPVKGKVIAQYHNSVFGPHKGIDIAVPTGTKVRAAAKGKVIAVKKPKKKQLSYVYIRHGKKMTTGYLHLSKVKVKEGLKVKRGEVIGRSGGKPSTRGAGFSTRPHLHLEVLKTDVQVKAIKFLKPRR
jgi:murein DD-endopeptidase MepM/ murein hydrolase activator NlpD